MIVFEPPASAAPLSIWTDEATLAAVAGVHMTANLGRDVARANMVEGGDTPLLSPGELASMGYTIAAYPLTLLSAAIHAMRKALSAFQRGEHPGDLLSFAELRKTIGFEAYDEALQRLTERPRHASSRHRGEDEAGRVT